MRHTVHIRREVRCSVSGKSLAAAAEAALDLAHATASEMTVVLSDSRRLRRLNARFAGVDSVTDVLAFPAADPADPRYLGDVVIGMPRVRMQARKRGVPLGQELRLLIVHGTLHLVGHDHRRPAERRRMWSLQSAALHRIGLDPARLDVER